METHEKDLTYQQLNPAVKPEELDTRQSIFDLTRLALKDWLEEKGYKVYRAKQIWEWLYVHHVRSFSEMTNIPHDLIENLEENFQFSPLEEVLVQRAEDGTTKYLFRMNDNLLIETVLMVQEYGLSVCVTTQVGCNVGCSFCASGQIAKQRDLTAGEIVSQIMRVQYELNSRGKDERVSHIVVMGIGEPFDNYDNVLDFLRIVNDDNGLAIGARHLTVSTSGQIPQIYKFADEDTQVNLAISLHAPNNDVRSSIMRINRKYPLEDLMAAIQYYMEKTNRRVTFEYIMIDGVNDQVEHAEQLVALLEPMRRLSYVNLIPYNPVEGVSYKRSPDEAIAEFFKVLRAGGITCTTRKEYGTEIEAACGQLRSNKMKRLRRKRK